jgi:hypothetical protein
VIHFHINRRNEPHWVRAIKLYVRDEWREQQLADKKTVFSTAICTYVTNSYEQVIVTSVIYGNVQCV